MDKIQRAQQSNIICALSQDDKVIIIYGPRQVGKTTLIKEVVKDLSQKFLYINGDRVDQHQILSSRDFSQIKGLLGNSKLLFVDEAQNIPDIGINIKIIHDELPDVKILITGSSSLDIADKMQEPLTGRTDTYHLYPLSLQELITHYSAMEVDSSLDQYMLYGMYPEIIKTGAKATKIKRLKEITSAYLYKDILALGNIKYSNKLRKLVQLLSYQIGQLVSIQELSIALQISQDTVVNYIDKLEKAFVVYRLSSYSKNPRKEVSKRDKIYFYDLGIRNAVIGNFNEISLRNDKGQIWENFMITERIKYNDYHDYYGSYYFWRTYGGAEIDLIESVDDQLTGYEFKYSKKKPRPPKSWTEGYENSTYSIIHRQNYLAFIQEVI